MTDLHSLISAQCPVAQLQPGIGEQPLAANADAAVVVIDLSESKDTTTTTFARLVMLRQKLIAQGRDLRLVGLRGRTKRLYEICRLQRSLPHADAPQSKRAGVGTQKTADCSG